MTIPAAPFGLYVHWPFCRTKCPYCDFASRAQSNIEQDRWAKAYVAALDRLAGETSYGPLTSVFFGGGTPALMAPATVAAILDRAERTWGFAEDVEITLEANPTAAEAGAFEGFRTAGINRLSLGIQALDDRSLKALGRNHDLAEAMDALALARRHFPRYSFDLIYARPGQSLADWQDELARGLDLAGDHLSLYQLTIEPGTAFHVQGVKAAAEDLGEAMFRYTNDYLKAAGLPAYEVSNHARPGGESRHNLLYWQGGDYLGLGPAAHGRVHRGGPLLAEAGQVSPEAWLAAVEGGGNGLAETLAVTTAEQIEERLLMGLRITEGLERTALEALAGRPLEDWLDAAPLIEQGFLELTDSRLRATFEGRLRLNAVIAHLVDRIS